MDFQDIELAGDRLNRPEDWASLRMTSDFEKDLVSVVVPTYNRAVFLPEALASIVNQTYRPIELLVVDDGSTDKTANVMQNFFGGLPIDRDFHVFYLRQPNRGASAARNQALLRSRGEFIQYLDSDDVIVNSKIERHVQVLNTAEDLDIVWSDWLVDSADQLMSKLAEVNREKPVGEKCSWLQTSRMLPWEPWPTLTRRRFLASQPLWNEFVSRWDDWELALRQSARCPRRAIVEGIGCIQREHNHGRRQDFDYNPKGVEVGLVACREAAKACEQMTEKNLQIRQAVAERCWETGIEALQRGTRDQAKGAFRLASKFAVRPAFRSKTLAAWLVVECGGCSSGRVLFAKYFRAN